MQGCGATGSQLGLVTAEQCLAQHVALALAQHCTGEPYDDVIHADLGISAASAAGLGRWMGRPWAAWMGLICGVN